MNRKFMGIIASAALALSLAACGGSSGAKPVSMDSSGNVGSNGGSVVTTADYVYFINGVESSTSYKTGSVVKGALMRVGKSALAALDGDEVKYETVVSKNFVSDDKNAGFYIYGDYVYYAVPSEEKDKSGAVKSGTLNFFKTKLDGRQTSSNLVSAASDKSGKAVEFSSSAQFRFMNAGNKVYLVVYSTNVYVFDTDSGKQVYSSENLTDSLDAVIFGTGADEGEAPAVFFSYKPVNESLYDKDGGDAQKVSYNEVYRISLGSEVKAEKVLDGIGRTEHGNDGENAAGSGLTGATVGLIGYYNGALCFSYTSLDDSSNVVYMSIPNDKLTSDSSAKWMDADANSGEKYVLTYKDDNSEKVFAATSVYYADDCILYSGDNGLMKYDYTKKNDSTTTYYGLSVLYSDDTVKNATLDFVNKEGTSDYLYYHNSSNYYKYDLTKALAGEDVKPFRINAGAVNTSWYKPEVVEADGKYYFVCVYDSTDYYSYNYVINMTEKEAEYTALLKEKDDAENDEKKAEAEKKIEDFYTVPTLTQSEATAYYKKSLLGVMSSSDKTQFDAYIKTLKETAEE